MQVSRITMFIDKNVTKTISVLESSLSENILPEMRNYEKVRTEVPSKFLITKIEIQIIMIFQYQVTWQDCHKKLVKDYLKF